jgi:hypothetical protein
VAILTSQEGAAMLSRMPPARDFAADAFAQTKIPQARKGFIIRAICRRPACGRRFLPADEFKLKALPYGTSMTRISMPGY